MLWADDCQKQLPMNVLRPLLLLSTKLQGHGPWRLNLGEVQVILIHDLINERMMAVADLSSFQHNCSDLIRRLIPAPDNIHKLLSSKALSWPVTYSCHGDCIAIDLYLGSMALRIFGAAM